MAPGVDLHAAWGDDAAADDVAVAEASLVDQPLEVLMEAVVQGMGPQAGPE